MDQNALQKISKYIRDTQDAYVIKLINDSSFFKGEKALVVHETTLSSIQYSFKVKINWESSTWVDGKTYLKTQAPNCEIEIDMQYTDMVPVGCEDNSFVPSHLPSNHPVFKVPEAERGFFMSARRLYQELVTADVLVGRVLALHSGGEARQRKLYAPCQEFVAEVLDRNEEFKRLKADVVKKLERLIPAVMVGIRRCAAGRPTEARGAELSKARISNQMNALLVRLFVVCYAELRDVTSAAHSSKMAAEKFTHDCVLEYMRIILKGGYARVLDIGGVKMAAHQVTLSAEKLLNRIVELAKRKAKEAFDRTEVAPDVTALERRITQALATLPTLAVTTRRAAGGADTSTASALRQGVFPSANFITLQEKLTASTSWDERHEKAQIALYDRALWHLKGLPVADPPSLEVFLRYIGRGERNQKAAARKKYRTSSDLGGYDGAKDWCQGATNMSALIALRDYYGIEVSIGTLGNVQTRMSGTNWRDSVKTVTIGGETINLSLYGSEAYAAEIYPGDYISYFYQNCQYGGHAVTAVCEHKEGTTHRIIHVSGNSSNEGTAIRYSDRSCTPPTNFDIKQATRVATEEQRKASTAYLRSGKNDVKFGDKVLVFSITRMSLVWKMLAKLSPFSEEKDRLEKPWDLKEIEDLLKKIGIRR